MKNPRGEENILKCAFNPIIVRRERVCWDSGVWGVLHPWTKIPHSKYRICHFTNTEYAKLAKVIRPHKDIVQGRP